MTERLDRVERDIADINSALNTMAAEFIRPLMQQSQANQQALAGLIEMTADAAVERAEQNTRIENMLNEAQSDRQEWRAGFDEMREQMNRDREENRRRFDAQQQISQAMLVELARVNSRLEILERAS